MPVLLTGSTALVPMSRLWRPMARTDRNRERRAPGTPAPTCAPTICRGVAPTNTDHPWASRSAVAASLGRLPTPSQATGRVKRTRQPASPRSRTSSSNPVPSSGESRANLTHHWSSGIRRSQNLRKQFRDRPVRTLRHLPHAIPRRREQPDGQRRRQACPHQERDPSRRSRSKSRQGGDLGQRDQLACPLHAFLAIEKSFSEDQVEPIQ